MWKILCFTFHKNIWNAQDILEYGRQKLCEKFLRNIWADKVIVVIMITMHDNDNDDDGDDDDDDDDDDN